ncbi:MAG: plasma-membrane proton-efflux P-type ATPase [Phycisphaerales bacterium]|nr:plasma-membrane proton-efflux P-type ATPase [Phycisphaerales bacterium]
MIASTHSEETTTRAHIELADAHRTAPPAGLTTTHAGELLAQFGPNEIAEHHERPLVKLLRGFWGPIPWMIEVAAVLSAVVGHWADFCIIAVLLLANVIVGFWEEYQAGNAIAALRKQLSLTARARRDGKWVQLPARELVPGDLVRLRLGDIVPADARIVAGDPVSVDQSALTGESLPVTRKLDDLLYSGSVVKQGEVDAEVYATGPRTYFGKTAHLVESAHAVSHFQRAVIRIGNYLIGLAVALVTTILVVAIARGDTIMTTLQFALVLTVAAIPVALPTVLTVTMAVGARLLAARQAIVSRLAAIEELAGMDVLCSDKTGTLTQNKLSVGPPYIAAGAAHDDVLRSAAWASRGENQDPIDLAVLAGLDKPNPPEYAVTRFVPFDPVHKRTEATVAPPGAAPFRVSKGAPQVILALAEDPPEVKKAAEEAVNRFAARGFRALGVARTDAAGHWHLLGVLPLSDPPREDSRDTIARAREMGVDVKMVTGDQRAIAVEVAQELALGTNIADASALAAGETDSATPAGADDQPQAAANPAATAAFDAAVEASDGFAQVFPEHKFAIVKSLQRRGHITGMTGDGVNDAPALRQADAGIAVAGATDAARAAAAIVLLAPGLSVVVDAIQEGRKIFQRMTSYATYRIAETIRVLFFMTLSILVFNFYPVTTVMIVLLALLNDGAILSIAYDRVRGSQRPEAWNMRSVLSIATILGLAGVVSSFGLFYLAERAFHLSADVIQSLMYLKLSAAGQLTIFLTRTRGRFWTSRPSNVLLVAVLTAQTIATLVAVYGIFMTPIGWQIAALVWAYALTWFLINDQIKVAAYRLMDRKHPAQPQVGRATA